VRDRRSVDDLSIEELEQILRTRKLQARMERLRRYEDQGRRRGDLPLPGEASPPSQGHQGDADPAHRSFVQESEPDDRAARGREKRTLRDNLLFAIEMLAALGLVAIMVFGATTLRDINREAAAAQASVIAELPTPTATPIISAVVLPGGHTPPTSPGGPQPNYDEVPQHLKPLVEQQFAGPAIAPTPGPGNAIRLRIPAIGVDAPIVQGDGWEQLKKGVGQHMGTPDPGEPGNIVLSAHNDIFGGIFRRLEDLQEGDQVVVQTLNREYVYRVAYWRITEPTEVSVMAPTQEPIVTLISCYPYMVDSDRIVVVGELVE
jgi:sortase A